jgi:hypothetical protein
MHTVAANLVQVHAGQDIFFNGIGILCLTAVGFIIFTLSEVDEVVAGIAAFIGVIFSAVLVIVGMVMWNAGTH